jgi:Uma2 family endonuclease
MKQCQYKLRGQSMPTAVARKIRFPTIADVQKRLGDIPEYRILSFPAPGTATVQDLLDGSITNGRCCELVDGILVEKAMGFRSDYIAAWILYLIAAFLERNNLGAVTGSQSPIRFKLNLVRMPDVSFIRWDSVDDTDEIENPAGVFLESPPDLAVEVLSPSNTHKEMETKLKEYARAGVELVWYVDPERKEVDVYPKGNKKRKKTYGVGGTLDGGEVLPGFTLPVAKIFQSRAPAKKPGKRGKK